MSAFWELLTEEKNSASEIDLFSLIHYINRRNLAYYGHIIIKLRPSLNFGHETRENKND
jgi:hypothetical protein